MKSRSAFTISHDKPRRIIQILASIDEFNELPGLKLAAVKAAHGLGHQMGSWHRRPNDPYGRWNNSCVDCGRMAVVALEPPAGAGRAYGQALTIDCLG